jgi:DNA-binding MarR family transcriptional regulator
MKSQVSGIRKVKGQVRLTFNDGLWQIFARTNHLVTKLRQKELRQHGINMNEAIVLFTALRLKNRATQGNMSRQLFWEPHTVSEQLKSMETKGLIRKVRDPAKQNPIRVEVTEKGLEAYRDSARRKSTREIMSVLTKEEQRQLWILLARVRERAMKKMGLHVSDPFPPSDPGDFRRRGQRRTTHSKTNLAEPR